MTGTSPVMTIKEQRPSRRIANAMLFRMRTLFFADCRLPIRYSLRAIAKPRDYTARQPMSLR